MLSTLSNPSTLGQVLEVSFVHQFLPVFSVLDHPPVAQG